MKNLQEKITKLNEFLVLDEEIKEELKTIIKDTYDYFCNGIVDYEFSNDGKTIECNYSYRCLCESDTDYCTIPVRWLEDDYDYKTDYEEMKRKAEEKRKPKEKMTRRM